jgi:thioredoxin 1
MIIIRRLVLFSIDCHIQQEGTMSAIQEVSDTTFETEVLKSNKTTIVDFWAPWCGPCRMMAPILEQVAGKNAETVKVVKLNTDQNQQTAYRYNITGIPSLLFFKDGREVHRAVGVQSAQVVQSQLEKIM